MPESLRPLIDFLPQAAQDVLDAGGWLVAAALVGLLVLALLVACLRRLLGRREGPAGPNLTEFLESYPPPPALLAAGPRLALYHVPVRLRLVTVAPLGQAAGDLDQDQVGPLLDKVVPGLARFLQTDLPRVRIWPTQLSHIGWFAAFRRHAVIPAEKGEPSRWVVLVGKIFVNGRMLGLGLALLADQENVLGRITLEQPHQWLDALRIQSLGAG